MSPPQLCPRCQVPMIEDPEYSGIFKCPIHPEHTKDVEAEPAPPDQAEGQARPLAQDTYEAQSVSFKEQAKVFNFMPKHLRSMGVFGPIGWVPQASQAGDGRLGYGPSGKKGGSRKSGRKRKKTKRGGKKFTGGEEWQGT